MTGWWYTATRSQKLAQIDGGIECGMTAKQIAMVCGAKIYAGGSCPEVSMFARENGRFFGALTERGLEKISEAQKRIWAERRGQIPQDAFTIFDTGEREASLELEF